MDSSPFSLWSTRNFEKFEVSHVYSIPRIPHGIKATSSFRAQQAPSGTYLEEVAANQSEGHVPEDFFVAPRGFDG